MLALVCHPVLDGNAAAEGLHTLDVSRTDGLGMIEEPSQLVERHVLMHAFEYIEEPGD